MRKVLVAMILAAISGSCKKEKYFDGPDRYEDGFESYTSADSMISSGDERWSFTQLTREGNSITIDTTNPRSGNKALKFTAARSEGDIVSKCSMAKQNMAFWEGEILRVSGWYYIVGTDPAEWLFLLDMEEQTAIGAGPGMRLALVNNQLRVEYKFYEKDIVQPAGQEVDLPRDQWVEIVWEVKLSQKEKGYVKLWQNGQLIIDSKNNRTLPKDILYSLQGTKGMYSSIEIGITANSRDSDLVIYVDDVKFERVE
jgi:hypothetical protein